LLKTLDTIDPNVVDALVDATSGNSDAIVIGRDGQPAVVAVNVSKYHAMARIEYEHAWAKVLAYAETEPFAHLSTEELEAWINAEVDAVRTERFEAGHHG